MIAKYPEVPWRQIIGMRNRVVHGYFEVDLDILWDVVTLDVPRLAERIRLIQSEYTPDPGADLSANRSPNTLPGEDSNLG